MDRIARFQIWFDIMHIISFDELPLLATLYTPAFMSTSIESLLTRELDVRFIDARAIATEARVSLGIQGYPSPDQLCQVRDEALRIYRSKSIQEQHTLQRLNMDLEAVKIPAGSSRRSSRTASSSSEELSTSSTSDLESLNSGCNRMQRARRFSSIFRGACERR